MLTQGKKISWSKLISVIFVLSLIVILPLLIIKKNKEPEALPLLGLLPNFSLINQDGALTQGDKLKGAILVVNFVFTSCPSTCPLLTAQMAKIQNIIKDKGLPNVQLLSISVDPRTDTPQVLKKYADKYKADYTKWTFLTGSAEDIQNVVINGFKIAMQKQGASDEATKDLNIMDITHGEQFVIVDRSGQIRAYRTANKNSDIERILGIIEKLI